MTNGTKAETSETEVWSGGYSLQALWSSYVILGALAIIAAVALWILQPFANMLTTWTLFLVASAGCVAVLFAVFLYQKLNRNFVLTTERIKHREGILTRTHYVLELIRVSDVTYDQGPIEALFGCGTIYVHSTDPSHPELVLGGIEKVRDVADQIDRLRREERRLRGVHVETI